MPTDEQKQRQQQELRSAAERIFRSEGALGALRYVIQALGKLNKPAFLGDSPADAHMNILVLMRGLADKAEQDLKEAQGALGATLAGQLPSVGAALANLSKAAEGDPRVVGSEEFQERIEANERS